MYPQQSSLARLQREHRLMPVALYSPQKENLQRLLPRYPESVDVGTTSSKYQGNVSLPALPPLKKLNKIEQTVQIYKGKVNKLPSLQLSDQYLQRKKQISETDGMRKSITPERRQGKRSSVQFAMRTKAGCQPNKVTKINQDAAILCPKNLENMGYKFFAVCDGHGQYGHMVSNQIKQQLPKHLGKLLKEVGNLESNIFRAFEITNNELCNSEIDTNLSGSTTVSLLMIKDIIYSANVGDSRAIMCRFDDGWQVVELSRDHKPDDPQEKIRILDAGGRVEQQKDFHGNGIGPFRVWLSYIQAPGLAMTRSFGDKVGAQAGVIAEPEIQKFSISAQDQFIVVASDGVWEYMSNEEVMSVVIPFLDKDNPEQAAERVVIEATQAWRRNSLARDDITCIVIFLQK
ncbi:unnamed protein product (macronuclear) [Paramecium tetraurelia]|uniref:PPM-type phosphatase domain-containing protein n=1 Tax=Paramecium tetraurelia TaxID=5888 RepID=A0BN90_PARTE|nr:uncharacterized protein GSPATT00030645001 [Paramecium tetraurelia]CAK60007.1 unnamed protein product [Paramecium tetraurelia]|eukprot:XP_001427405.1 hypothetical protein (macronuclear) [Paramecium tetraurelia strain d4-2]